MAELDDAGSRDEMLMSADSSGALAPYRVVDLSGELGALCTVMLTGLGADVIRIEPPEGHADRRKPPFLDPDMSKAANKAESLYWLFMNGGKRSLTLDLEDAADRDLLRRLATTADILVESGWGLQQGGELASLGLGYDDLRAVAPDLIYTSITPFGQDGPKAGWQGSDLIGMAAGGLLKLCGDRDRAPVRVTAEQGHALAGVQATVGALLALRARQTTGRGQHVDVSMQDAVSNALGNARLYYAMEGMITHRAGGGRAFGNVGTRMIFASSDGHVAFIRVPQTFSALGKWLDDEGAARRFEVDRWSKRALVGSAMPSADEVAELEGDLIPFFAARTTNDLYEDGQQRGLMICPVSRMQDLAENPQLLFREYYEEVSHPDLSTPLRQPGAPFKMSATPWRRGGAPSPGADNAVLREELRTVPLPRADSTAAEIEPDAGLARQLFQGLRIADFSWVGVGPNASQQFAWHGAQVNRVESSLRPDTFRGSGPLAPDVEGLDRSAYWVNHNRDKLAIQLNLRAPEAAEVARRLVAQSDIVTESFTPGFMREVGLDYESLRAIKPDLIMISMSMEGQGGPHEAFRGFGLILQATAGITGLTGWPDRPPVGTGVAYTDWFATYCAASALLAAVDHRERTGEGQYIDLSQLESTIYGLDAALVRFLNTGDEARRLGNRHPEHAPHGVFPCLGDDRWCAVAVTSDEAWRGLCELLGRTDWAADASLDQASGRLSRQEELEQAVAVWTAARRAEEVQDLMQSHGVAAHLVATTGDVEADLQIRHRGHLWKTDHPVIGPLTYDGPAYRLSETRAAPHRAAPLMGEHNEYVYKDLLGYSDDEFVGLLARDVIR